MTGLGKGRAGHELGTSTGGNWAHTGHALGTSTGTGGTGHGPGHGLGTGLGTGTSGLGTSWARADCVRRSRVPTSKINQLN